MALAAKQTTCFGREQHLATISEALAEAKRGTGSLVGISGPSGIGKSTFLEKAVTNLQREGARVIRVNCRAGGAHGPLTALLREMWIHFGHSGGSARATQVEQLLDSLRRPSSHETERSKSPRGREHIFGQLAEMLRAAAETTPLAVVFADADAADNGTHELVAYLARVLASMKELGSESFRGLLVVTATALEDISVASWTTGLELVQISLLGLDRQALREYLASDDVIERVMRLTEGVPQQVEELIAGIYSKGRPTALDRAESPVEAELLKVLAALGRPVSVEWLSRIVATPESGRGIAQLTQREILQKDLLDGQLRISFKRVGDERAVCDALSREEQRRIHGMIADALDEQYAFSHALADVGAPALPVEALDQYAEHLLRANAGEQAVAAALAAGQQLEIMFCHERAAELYERALEQAPGSRKLQLLRVLVEVYQRTTKLDRAIELAERIEKLEPTPRATLRRAQLHLLKGDLSTAQQLLDALATVTSLHQDPLELSQVHAARADVLCLTGDLLVARETANMGLQACRDGNNGSDWRDSSLAIQLQNTLARVEMELGHESAARELVEANVRLARGAGLLAEEARAAIQLGVLALNADDPTTAATHYENARRLAVRLDDQRILGACNQHLGVSAERQGELGQALSFYQQAVSCWKKVGHRSYLAWVAIDIGKLYLRLGDTSKASAMVDISDKLSDAKPPLGARINTELLRGQLAQRHLRYRDAESHFGVALSLAKQGAQCDRAQRAELALALLSAERQGIDRARAELQRLAKENAASRVRVDALLALAARESADEAWVARGRSIGARRKNRRS
jgi:tetratricopeptide (TPR) repeat protein